MLLLGASGLSVTYADLGTLLETVHVLEMKQNMSGRGVPLTIKLKQDHVFLQLNVQVSFLAYYITYDHIIFILVRFFTSLYTLWLILNFYK